MPDIFDTDQQNAQMRDRRFTDGEEEQTPAEAGLTQQTLSHTETIPQAQQQTPLPQRKNSMHMFSAYCERPAQISFETQEEQEEILLLLRKSFITNIPWIFFGIVFTIIPLFLISILPSGNSPFSLIPNGYTFVLLSLYYLVVATYMFVSFITWYFNTSLITNIRVVDIDFSDLVYKNIAETKMDLVQDVSFTQAGALRTLFNFGDVLIQTAGALDNFDLEAVPHPDKAVEIVENLIGKEERAHE